MKTAYPLHLRLCLSESCTMCGQHLKIKHAKSDRCRKLNAVGPSLFPLHQHVLAWRIDRSLQSSDHHLASLVAHPDSNRRLMSSRFEIEIHAYDVHDCVGAIGNGRICNLSKLVDPPTSISLLQTGRALASRSPASESGRIAVTTRKRSVPGQLPAQFTVAGLSRLHRSSGDRFGNGSRLDGHSNDPSRA